VSDRGVVAVLHGEVPAGAPADEQDVLVEVRHVSAALEELGYHPVPLAVSLDLQSMARHLGEQAPVAVFNLVESLAGRDVLQHLAPSVIETLGIAHTGSGADAVYCTTNKHLAKQIMTASGIPTPAWQRCDDLVQQGAAFGPAYMVKLTSEDASRGISDSSVKAAEGELLAWARGLSPAERSRYIVEQFVPGREFNISVLDGPDGPQVLPPAEMTFVDYPPGKPEIVGFSAKWDSDSFEYHHTVRRFEFGGEDTRLLERLRTLAQRSWKAFGLAGYARVDFRVDPSGRPWVLEANINPCLSPDGGFVAASQRAGMTYVQVIERIMATAK